MKQDTSVLESLEEKKRIIKEREKAQSAERKKVFADNLKYYSKKIDMPHTELCRTLGIEYPTYNDWLRGRSYPRLEKIQRLADFFNCTLQELIEPHSFEDNVPVEIPILGSLDETDVIGYLFTSRDAVSDGKFFAFRISGDSMAPEICNGDTVIIRQTQDAETNDIVIVSIAGDISCKILEKNSDGITLIPQNAKYSPLYFDNATVKSGTVKLIGVVTEIRRPIYYNERKEGTIWHL